MSATATIDAPDLSRELRHLRECAARVRRLLGRNGGARSTLRVAVGSRSIRITPVQSQLCLREDPKQREIAELLRQALAWEVKCLADEERWEQSGADGASSLLVDAALGRWLLGRIGPVVERWGHRGSREDRQLLLAARGEIARRLDQILSRADIEQARLPRLVARIEERQIQSAQPEDPPPSMPSPRRRKARPERGGKGWVLAGALVLAGLALFVAMNASTWYHRPSSGLLALDDFASLPMVQEIEDRPPSVFFVVDSHAWSGLEPARRSEVVAHVREIIRGQGYEGALLSTDDGAVVAQWTLRGGTVLYPAAPSESITRVSAGF